MSEPRTGRPEPPPFPLTHIRQVADRLYADYVRAVGETSLLSRGIRFREFYEEVVYPQFEVGIEEGYDLGVDDDGKKILATYEVRDNTVVVDRCIGPDAGDPRRIFTLHHEVVGHGVLQGDWLREQLAAGHPHLVRTTAESLRMATIDRLEKQANAIAALTAAPEPVVVAAVAGVFRPSKLFKFPGPCHYWLCPNGQAQRVWVDSAQELASRIGFFVRGRFDGLSAEALGYRILSIGFVRDQSEPIVLRRTLSRARFGRPTLGGAPGQMPRTARPFLVSR